MDYLFLQILQATHVITDKPSAEAHPKPHNPQDLNLANLVPIELAQ
jgi:hypothetical protein